jgi:hypothetical protein
LMIQHLQDKKARAGQAENRDSCPLRKVFSPIKFGVSAKRTAC